MGFNITKGKSWKNAGKSLGKSKTWENAGKSTGDWFTDDVGGKQTGDWFKDLGDKKTYEDLGNNTMKTFGAGGDKIKDTWNAAASGIDKGLGGIGDAMSNALLAGGVAVAAFIVISLMPEKKRIEA